MGVALRKSSAVSLTVLGYFVIAALYYYIGPAVLLVESPGLWIIVLLLGGGPFSVLLLAGSGDSSAIEVFLVSTLLIGCSYAGTVVARRKWWGATLIAVLWVGSGIYGLIAWFATGV